MFTVSLDTISDHNWPLHFFIAWTVDNPVLHEAITSFQLSPVLKGKAFL
jgi:hypothetical protein